MSDAFGYGLILGMGVYGSDQGRKRNKNNGQRERKLPCHVAYMFYQRLQPLFFVGRYLNLDKEMPPVEMKVVIP